MKKKLSFLCVLCVIALFQLTGCSGVENQVSTGVESSEGQIVRIQVGGGVSSSIHTLSSIDIVESRVILVRMQLSNASFCEKRSWALEQPADVIFTNVPYGIQVLYVTEVDEAGSEYTYSKCFGIRKGYNYKISLDLGGNVVVEADGEDVDTVPPVLYIDEPLSNSSIVSQSWYSRFTVKGTFWDNDQVCNVFCVVSSLHTNIVGDITNIRFTSITNVIDNFVDNNWSSDFCVYLAGLYTIKCWAVDNVGNVSIQKEIPLHISVSTTISATNFIDNNIVTNDSISVNGFFQVKELATAWMTLTELDSTGVPYEDNGRTLFHTYEVISNQLFTDLVPLSNQIITVKGRTIMYPFSKTIEIREIITNM